MTQSQLLCIDVSIAISAFESGKLASNVSFESRDDGALAVSSDCYALRLSSSSSNHGF